MKANELRIGNLLDLHGQEDYKVIGLDPKYITVKHKNHESTDDGSNLLPIPLTEEWLLKFGFEKDDVGWVINMNKETQLASGDEDSVWYIGSSIYWGEVPQNIKHVHTLQNLYFALTGEELNETTDIVG